MKNNEKDELMETTILKESVEEFLKDPCDERAVYVMTHVALLAATGSKAYMPLLNLTCMVLDFNPDTKAEDLFGDNPEPDELFAFIESEDGCRWFPLYTDMSELDGAEKTNAVRVVTVRSIIEAALDTEAVDGIMINPNSDSFAISRDAFEFMLEQADKYAEMGIPASAIRSVSIEKKDKDK